MKAQYACRLMLQLQYTYYRTAVYVKWCQRVRSRSIPAFVQVGVGYNNSTTTTTTTNQIRTSTGTVGVPQEVNSSLYIYLCMPFSRYFDCCIGHSSSTHAGPDLVGGGGCMLYSPPPCTAWSWCLHLAWAVFSFHQLQLVQLLQFNHMKVGTYSKLC